MELHDDLLSNDLSVNSTSQSYLLISAKWGKFLAIVGFFFCGFMIIAGFVATMVMSSNPLVGFGNEFLKYVGFIYVILAIVLFFPCYFLLKFSNKILEAFRTSNQESLDSAFMNLKSMFKFYGISTVVILCFYALAFLFGIFSRTMR